MRLDVTTVWKILIAVCIIAAGTPAFAEIINGGFESNNLDGWTTSGTAALTSVGFDPRTLGALPLVGAGTHSVKVGDEDAWNYLSPDVSSITQTWMVGASFTELYVAWAAVGLAPDAGTNHLQDETPWFQIKVTDVTAGGAALLAEEDYTGILGSINPGWLAGASQNGSGSLGHASDGVWYYRPWETFQLDVTGLVGHDLSVTLTTGDCRFGGHTSYAYLDVFDNAASVASVPEPGTLLLLGYALAGMYGIRRRLK